VRKVGDRFASRSRQDGDARDLELRVAPGGASRLALYADSRAHTLVTATVDGVGLDAFVVRKSDKTHGLTRRIEGPDVRGRRVLAVEDTSTTGSSVLAAVEALRAAGAEVVGVATVVDRGAADAVESAGLAYRSVYTSADLGL
jgi:orotate phosphoribosyltransferase